MATAAGGRTIGGRSARLYDVGQHQGVTMAEARMLHGYGVLQAHNGGGMGTLHPRQGRHASGAIVLNIDLSEMHKVARGLHNIATSIEQGRTVISRTINFGLRKLQTQLTRDLKQWTGIRVTTKVRESMKLHFASPANLTGILRVRSGHTAVTKAYYGASWSKANPGATHSAWNRSQIAVGTFMAPSMKPVMRRTTSARLPIAPLWGPNMAREVDRHRPEVDARVQAVGLVVAREAARLMRVAIAKAGG